MNPRQRGHLAALAFLLSFAASAAEPTAPPLADAPQLSGAQAFADGAGGVVLVLLVSNHQRDKVSDSSEAWDASLVRVGDGARIRLLDATKPAVHALPAGRYWLASVRSRGGRVLSGIGTPERWFEVAAGRIGYAGRWQVTSTIELDLQSSIKTEVSFPREPLAALATDPAGPLARYGFALAPVGKPLQAIEAKK